jgi:hypothetical protein
VPLLDNSPSPKRLRFTPSLAPEIPVPVLGIIPALDNEDTLVSVYAKVPHSGGDSGLPPLIAIA